MSWLFAGASRHVIDPLSVGLANAYAGVGVLKGGCEQNQDQGEVLFACVAALFLGE